MKPEISYGKPIYEGRYVVYVPGVLGWLEPHIVLWRAAAWYFQGSTEKYPDDVKCWIGPLPVVKDKPASPPPPPLEYDL